MTLETEVAVRSIAHKAAPELRIESSPSSPRADDHTRRDRSSLAVALDDQRLEVDCGPSRKRARASGGRRAEEQVIEQEATHAARGAREVELVLVSSRHDA